VFGDKTPKAGRTANQPRWAVFDGSGQPGDRVIQLTRRCDLLKLVEIDACTPVFQSYSWSIALSVSSALSSSRLCRFKLYAAWMGWRRKFRSILPITVINAQHN
jgi:hypothetical protein